MSTIEKLKEAATGTALKPIDRIKNKLASITEQMSASIPETMRKYYTPERVIRLFWQEARRNTKLQKCDPTSIATSLLTACQLGLEIGVQGQAYLVPYGDQAQFIIGYKGLLSLARRSGEVMSIETHIAYENDKFDLVLGLETKLEHVPCLDGERGSARLVYGVAKFREGGTHFDFMTKKDVDKIRARSKSANNGPWATDWEQMARKTIIRRMSNYLPMSIEFANAVALDNAHAEGKKASLEGEFVTVEDDVPPDVPSVTEKVVRTANLVVEPTNSLATDIEQQLTMAKTMEELDMAADLIRNVHYLADKNRLGELYRELKEQFK